MRGDDDFEDFYHASYPRLVGQLTVLTGSLEDAEDAMQEAFARASTPWVRLRAYDAPEAWVRRVAVNLATSGLRRTRRQLVALARLGTVTAESAHSTDRLAIEAGSRRLSLRQQEVLVLHYGANLPVEEVARQLRVPPGTAKIRLARARAALGAYLEEAQEEPTVSACPAADAEPGYPAAYRQLTLNANRSSTFRSDRSSRRCQDPSVGPSVEGHRRSVSCVTAGRALDVFCWFRSSAPTWGSGYGH